MIFPYADDAPEDRSLPWMTWLLIGVNVVVYINVTASGHPQAIFRQYGFIPERNGGLGLVTSMFLHADLDHLIGNMWFLYLFGNNVEARCNPLTFFCAYIICGVCGTLNHNWLFPHSTMPTIGASGAISGVMAMYLFFFPANRIRIFCTVFYRFFWLRWRAVAVIGLWFLAECFLYSAIDRWLGRDPLASGIAHTGHVGGFLAGIILAGVLTATGMVLDDGRNAFARLTGIGEQPAPPIEWQREREERMTQRMDGAGVERDDEWKDQY
jgi:membrane associated rhomboid family serine protease